MTTTGNGKGLLMTYKKAIYSFDCDSPTTCFWTEEETKLKISRRNHIMLTVPTSVVDDCDCQLNSDGVCRCPTGVTGEACDQCKQGYWGLQQNDSLACKSKFCKFSEIFYHYLSCDYFKNLAYLIIQNIFWRTHY